LVTKRDVEQLLQMSQRLFDDASRRISAAQPLTLVLHKQSVQAQLHSLKELSESILKLKNVLKGKYDREASVEDFSGAELQDFGANLQRALEVKWPEGSTSRRPMVLDSMS